MPFMFGNTTAVCQEFVIDILQDILYAFVLVYVDNILVFSSDFNTYWKHVPLKRDI